MDLVAFGASAMSSFSRPVAITDTDVDVKIFLNSETTENATLSQSAQGNMRVSTNNNQIVFYSYSTAGLAEGTLIREEVTSLTAAFQPYTAVKVVGKQLTNVLFVPNATSSANGTCCSPLSGTIVAAS